MTTKITKCRICDNENLETVLDLGEQYLSGVFPNAPEMEHKSSLKLVKCREQHSDSMRPSCGHLQLEETFSSDVMYGKDYGYRSGLNKSMVTHLKGRVDEILKRFDDNKYISLKEGDVVLDIAGNDGTTLGFYPKNLRRINIDPTAEKFKQYQPEGVEYVAELFSVGAYNSVFGDQAGDPVKVITAFSMFYDLDRPREFLMSLDSVIHKDALIVFEQSYMPLMYDRMAYDTVCHEHLSYYAVKQFDFMFKQLGFKFVDISFNDCNGGSFVVTACRKESEIWEECTKKLSKILASEKKYHFDILDTWKNWEEQINETRDQLKEIIAGKKVAALGASTKGNVVLQYCGLGPEDIEAVGDVNPDKHGCYTPGTWIPITDEDTVLAGDYDYYLVLPWHFKEFFINNPKFKGKTLLFPLPEVHTVTVE